MANPIARWFDWLQAGAPTGEVERYPELTERGETSVPGVFVVGDLTGLPLLRLAADSGHKLVEALLADDDFSRRRADKPEGVLDLLIIGAGPAGVAAAMTAHAEGLDYAIVESTQPFQTIRNFPVAKPIFAEPSDWTHQGPVQIDSGVKEGLLSNLEDQLTHSAITIEQGVRIERLARSGDHVLATDSSGQTRAAVAVALAIGKTGDARTLGVAGEDLPHVSNRLFDPGHHHGEDIVVVGGGDSAVEAAVSLAQAGNRVTLAYRKAELTRPKADNLSALQTQAAQGQLTLALGTEVTGITPELVRFTDGTTAPAQAVFVLIGRQIPLQFLHNSGIRMEGELGRTGKLLFALSVLFANVVYFGKSAQQSLVLDAPAGSSLDAAVALAQPHVWSGLLAAPTTWLTADWGAWTWKSLSMSLVAWASLLAMVPVLGLLAAPGLRALQQRTTLWQRFQWTYFAAAMAFFCWIYFGSQYLGFELLGHSPGFWYGLLYCVTMTVFGLRRVHVRPTRYIRAQTATLVAIQWVMLWLLPEILIPGLGEAGALGPPDGFWRTQVFPGDSWWRAYGFVLAWPLFIWNVFDGAPTGFWLATSAIQTFVLIPLGIRYFGKGFYCGWICSCGGLAETLGDAYRTRALHGPTAKRWENAGQVVLAVAVTMTALKLATAMGWLHTPLPDHMGQAYALVVDVIFAGVLGLGVYFFMSGRVWCRFLCPLAALMHIYTKFTRYRIFARKERCISCNVCTKSCHMGIDVMAYAVRGQPMDDVQCVRCSACVVNCPTDVLHFGSLNEGQATSRIGVSIR